MKKPSEEWKERLRNFSMRIGFNITLTKTMLEFICAVADEVQWDRALYRNGQAMAENWFASELALTKRGLIQRKPKEVLEKEFEKRSADGMCTDAKIASFEFYEHNVCELTPAGKCVVELLKMAGLFVESDAAINKKSRRKRA